MFCEKCGAQIPDDALFCENCGAKVEQEDTQYFSGESEQSNPRGKRIRISKKLVIWICVAAAAVIVLIVLLITLILPRVRTVNLNDYIVIGYSGYDTRGEALWEFDTARFEKDYEGKIQYSQQAQQEIAYYVLNYSDALDFIESYIYGALDQTYGLSNGDSVTFEWYMDSQVFDNYFNYSFEYSDFEDTVEGLEEIQTFDPFEDIELVFSGTSPYGTAEVINNARNEMESMLTYWVTPSDGLENGMTVTVSIDEGWTDYFIENYGTIPSETSKEYTVEGLDSYVTSLDSLSDEVMEQMKSQSEDAFNAYMAGNWSSDSEILKGMSYVGSILLIPKSTNYYDFNDRVYLVFKVTVNNVRSSIGLNKTFDYYTFYYYDNVTVSADGTCHVDVTEYRSCSNSFYKQYSTDRGSASFSYHGYETLQELLNNCITRNIDYYIAYSDIEGSGVTEATEEEEVEDKDYILPDSSTKKLTLSDISGLSKEELRLARNEIYARKGRLFDDEELQAYFNSKSWYNGTIKPDDFTSDMLSETEKANLDLIKEYESDMGYN